MRRWMLTIVAAAQFSGAMACDITFDEGWVPMAPSVATMWAGYGVARNRGDKPALIQSVASAQFASATLHETILKDGMEHMRPIERAEIPPRGELRFAPNGRHIMLMRPSANLASLKAVDVALSVSGCAAPVTVRLPVREYDPASDAAHGKPAP